MLPVYLIENMETGRREIVSQGYESLPGYRVIRELGKDKDPLHTITAQHEAAAAAIALGDPLTPATTPAPAAAAIPLGVIVAIALYFLR